VVRLFAVLLAVFPAFGCRGFGDQVVGRVTTFHVLDSTPRTFVIVPSTEQAESLEFQSYAKRVSDELVARGWRPTTFETANVAVFLQYQISSGQRVEFSYPVLGQVPTGTSTTTGTVNTYGNTATYNATTTQQTTLGVVGTQSGSRVEYDRAVQLTMYSVKAYTEANRMERVYEATIRSSGSAGDLATVMPALVRGLMEDFPGESGATKEVSVPLR
jgi:hypothetical protein